LNPFTVVGHEWAVEQLQQALDGQRVPQALLLTGPESVGKHTLARWLAAALLCETPAEAPCGVCRSCRRILSGNHPDVLWVEPEGAKAQLKIDQIRGVERFLALTPLEGTHKVAIIGEFDRANVSAANALLKTLEEPPRYAHLILLAEDAERLLPTITSRTQQITLRPLAPARIAEALERVWHVDQGTAWRLAQISGGRIGWAVVASQDPSISEQLESALGSLADALAMELPERFALAAQLARAPEAFLEMLEYWLLFWRDVLSLQTGQEQVVTDLTRPGFAQYVADSVLVTEVAALLEALVAARDAVRANANLQLLLESLMLDLPQVNVPQIPG